MTGILIRRWEERHTRRMPCEDKGKDWTNVSTSLGNPKISSKAPEARKRQGRILLQISDEA